MDVRNEQVLIPQYMHHFQCIGSECEDNCCIGWRVIIDEDSYKKYRKVADMELRSLLEKSITRNRSNPSPLNYAKIKLKADGYCPFMNDKDLCSIQLSLGEEALSITCATYPRIYSNVNGVLEKSATMSCPEAARLALLNKDKMEFDYILEPVSRTSEQKIINTHELKVLNKPQHYFWELRIFTIHIVQDRNYNIAERLIILGLFYQKIAEITEAGQVGEIPNIIANYTNLADSGVFHEELSKIPVNYSIQIKILKTLIGQRVLQGINSKRYIECYQEFLEGIAYNEETTEEELVENYRQAYQDYYEPFMQKREYILENYLVNYVFKNLFPFGDERGIFDNYVMLVIHYAMIKLHLIGMAKYHKDLLNEELVIKLIQSFAKVVEHNIAYLQWVYDLLKENDFTSMAHMVIFIKN